MAVWLTDQGFLPRDPDTCKANIAGLSFNFVEDHLELAGDRSLTGGAKTALLSKTELLLIGML